MRPFALNEERHMRDLRKRAVFYGLVILLGVLCALPSLLPAALRDELPAWYAGTHLNLGLDLRGGSFLLMEMDVEQLMLDENIRIADDLSQRLRQSGIRHGEAQVSPEGFSLPLRGAGLEDAA